MDIEIYFAGPDVFSDSWRQFRESVTMTCRGLGVTPLFPADEPTHTPAQIVAMNLDLIRRSSGVCANLLPFRGAEPDSGTCFEVGFAFAIGKPVFAVVPGDTVMERVGRLFGPVSRHGEGWPARDSGGYGVEDFSFPLNIMLHESVFAFHDMPSAISAARNAISNVGRLT